MNPIPSFRAAHLVPYVNFLRNIGAPVQGGLARAKLPDLFADRPDSYLPQAPTVAFLTEMSRSEGIDNLTLRALQDLKLASFGEEIRTAVLAAPTLYAALQNFRELVLIEDTNLALSISMDEQSCTLSFASQFPLQPLGLEFEDWNELLALLTVVRAFAGSAWAPEEMAFRHCRAPSRYALERLPDTRLIMGQGEAWMTMPRELLARPLRRKPKTARSVPDRQTVQTPNSLPAWDLVSTLSKVLEAYLVAGHPPIELAAELAETSVRTLQRKLSQANTTYSAVVQRARFEVASERLKDPGEKIIDIAYDLGYADPAHFSRAFSRLAGCSPRAYRKYATVA